MTLSHRTFVSPRSLTLLVTALTAGGVLAGVGGVAQAQSDQGPLALTKTVGTDPDICAATSEIEVLVGTEVNYCYTITNNSEFTVLQFHDLYDDQLGDLLSSFAYDLAPGASVFLMSSQAAGFGMSTITADVTNTATWTVTDSDGVPVVESTDTATVTVSAPIDVVKTVGTDPDLCATTSEIEVPAGTEVNYCYTITNTAAMSFDLHDVTDDRLGDLLTDFSFNLAPGASVFLMSSQAQGIGMTTITQDVTNEVTWTVRNTEMEYAFSGMDTATVRVSPPDSTTTTESPTTEASTSTTELISTTTVSGSTVAPMIPAPSTTSGEGLPPTGELPQTGSGSSSNTLTLAFVLLGAGVALAAFSRRQADTANR